eukprot:1155757-Pelagomonas_calceolata.AAC.4
MGNKQEHFYAAPWAMFLKRNARMVAEQGQSLVACRSCTAVRRAGSTATIRTCVDHDIKCHKAGMSTPSPALSSGHDTSP